jgi:hypothetical protein
MRKRNQVIESSEAVRTISEPLRLGASVDDDSIDVDDLPVPSNGIPILTRAARDSTVRGRRASKPAIAGARALRERVLSRRRRWRR